MDDSIYATSFSLYSLALPTPPRLLSLLSADDATLKIRSKELYDSLISPSRRPIYEVEEEKARLGSLRSCHITQLPLQHGIVLAIAYDRVVYKSIFYTYHTSPQTSIPLLLIKANSSLTRRLFLYFTEFFDLPSDPEPLKLSASLLLSALRKYIVSLRTNLDPVEENESILSLLRDIIGILKITITVNAGSAGGAAIVKNLRTIDVGINSETLYQLLEQSIPDRPGPKSKRRGEIPPITFLHSLQHHIRDRTGLILPIIPDSTEHPLDPNAGDTLQANEAPLRVTRVQSTAFAIGMEGRLKFSSKPVEMMDTVPGLTSGDENVVRAANRDLLAVIVNEAMSAGSAD
ncbi:hypothetical protein DV736_g3337, partial [Chaetothyriales sp. CBS 134916]